MWWLTKVITKAKSEHWTKDEIGKIVQKVALSTSWTFGLIGQVIRVCEQNIHTDIADIYTHTHTHTHIHTHTYIYLYIYIYTYI